MSIGPMTFDYRKVFFAVRKADAKQDFRAETA